MPVTTAICPPESGLAEASCGDAQVMAGVAPACFHCGTPCDRVLVRLGEKAARWVNIFTVTLSYVLVLYLVFIARFFSPTVMLVFLAIGRGWNVIKLLSQPRPKEAPPGFDLWPRWFSTPQLRHIRLFGGLYILGIFLDVLLKMYVPGFWQ